MERAMWSVTLGKGRLLCIHCALRFNAWGLGSVGQGRAPEASVLELLLWSLIFYLCAFAI